MLAKVQTRCALCIVALPAAVILSACSGDANNVAQAAVVIPGANIHRGERLVVSHNCVACHAIADLPDASGTAGPPLTGFASRALIAGELANNPDNLVRWILKPSAVEPRTVMPDMGLTSDEARDVAGYLYTLK